MKRDLPLDPVAADDAFASRLSALAAGLREGGVAPERDLWPEIENALGGAGARERRVTSHGAARYGVTRTWAGAALAATVLLAIGIGVADLRPGQGARTATPGTRGAAGTEPVRSGSPATARQGLHEVDEALNEIQAALRQSPDDPDLSRLVMLIHHSRGRLLRLQAEGGVRDARGGRS